MKTPISSSLSKITPVILSGGAGTRLWPVSRRQFPKQFAALLNEKNLFSAALSRVSDRTHYTRPIIVGNNEHKFFILDALDKLNITDALVLLEPIGRNTAAAAITTALYEIDKGFSGLHLVMPSDHLVADETAFHLAAHEAAAMARKGNIVLFGINPEFPETGYGYITPGEAMDKSAIKKIKTFHEKPDSATAQKLIHKGALWNSGIFLYDPKVLCEEAKALAPDYFADCKSAADDAREDAYGCCVTLGKEAYEGMKSHAFDTLIMEQTKKGAVLSCSMGWNDIGSWQALWKITPKNEEGNALLGPVVAHDVKSSYIRSEGPTIAVLGMEDCMVVATKDAVMVAPCSRSQEIKGLLALVENNNSDVAHAHTTISRPWGTYESIAQGTHFRVKHIVVRPARSLSLQMHHHRAEHWVVVGGTALVECNGVEKLIFPNESIFIPQGASHRLTNPGKIDLQLIEVQSGEYLQEDDIVRFDDVYGRVQQTS